MNSNKTVMIPRTELKLSLVFLVLLVFNQSSYAQIANPVEQKWLNVKFSNTMHGTIIRVKSDGNWQQKTITNSSQVKSGLHFGLDDLKIDELYIEWPSGEVFQTFDVPLTKSILVSEPGSNLILQNITIGNSTIYSFDKIIVGRNVDKNRQIGDVILNSGSTVNFISKNGVQIGGGFNTNGAFFRTKKDPSIQTTSNLKTIIPEEPEDDLLSIYPNPVKDELNIQYLNSELMDIKLVNILGVTMFSRVFSSDEIVKLNMKGLPAGLYVLKIKTNDSIVERRIIKN